MQKNKISWLYLAVIFAVLVLLDQAVKFLFVRYLGGYVSYNGGGAFSLAEGYTFYKMATLVITVFISALLFFTKGKSRLFLLFVVSGAVSNQIDRMIKPGVVDFIDFKIWPSFNMADIYIFVGVCLLVLGMLRQGRTSSI